MRFFRWIRDLFRKNVDTAQIEVALEKEDRRVAEIALSEYIHEYPHFFINLAEKYPNPLQWDNLFRIHRLSITATLKIFFAEHGYIYSKREVLNYDKSQEAVRVVAYQILITRRDNKAMVYQGSGNPMDLIPDSILFMMDAINKDSQGESVESKEINMPMRDVECKTCVYLEKNNSSGHEICPECGTPTSLFNKLV